MTEILPRRREQLQLWATWTMTMGMSEGTLLGLLLVGALLYGGIGLAMAQWVMLQGAAMSVAFSMDRHSALSGSWDGTLRLWRLD